MAIFSLFYSVLSERVLKNLKKKRKYQGFVNGGFQTVVRVWSGEQIPAPHFYLSFTSITQFYLGVTSIVPFLTSFLPQFNLRSTGNLEPRFGSHGLQTLGNNFWG